MAKLWPPRAARPGRRRAMLPTGNPGLQEKLSTATIQPESRSAFCPGARGSGAQRSRRLRTGAPGSDRPRRSGPGRSRRIRFNRNRPHCIGTLHLTACRKAIPAAPFLQRTAGIRGASVALRRQGAAIVEDGAQKRTAPERRRSGRRLPESSGLRGFHLEDLAAAVHAGLEVDVVRAAKLARILVLDIGRGLQRVGRAAHAAARRRGLSFRNGHGSSPVVWATVKSEAPNRWTPEPSVAISMRCGSI